MLLKIEYSAVKVHFRWHIKHIRTSIFVAYNHESASDDSNVEEIPSPTLLCYFLSCQTSDFEFLVISSVWSSFHVSDGATLIDNGP